MIRFTFPVFSFFALILLSLSALPARAEQTEEQLKPENGMYLLWSMGDLVKSRDPRTSEHKIWKDEWIYELVAGLVMNSSPVDNLRLTVNLEVGTYNIYPRNPFGYNGEPSQDTQFDTYIEEAKGVFTFGKEAPTKFDIEFGYFLNRYNSHARVFGEYLFRTMIYPSIIFNSFDYPWTYLSGVRVGHDLAKNFHHDLYFLTEFDHFPYFDFSVAYQAGYNIFNLAEIGAGANFQRIIPVRPSFTTPEVPQNTYVEIPAQAPVVMRDLLGNPVLDSVGNPVTLSVNAPLKGFLDGKGRFRQLGDSLFMGGQRVQSNYQFLPGLQTEKTVYSFSGTIVMGRFAIFPMGLMQEPSWKKMVSLYGEMAVLGVQNYPGLYENMEERIPIMGGVQFSFPRIIDALAFEVEHFGSKTVPSFYHRGRNNVPQPGEQYGSAPNDSASVLAAEERRLGRDDWKWSLYARKQFKGIALALQVGTDHMRRVTGEDGTRYDEILTNPSQWYWQLRIRIPY